MNSTSDKTDLSTSSRVLTTPEFSGRPLTIAAVFDEAFDLYKRHFSLLAVISATVMAPIFLVGHILDVFWLHPLQASLSGSTDPDIGRLILAWLGAAMFGDPGRGLHGLLSLLGRVIVSAPIAVAVSDLYIGRVPRRQECFRRSRPYMGRTVRGYICGALATLVVAFVVTLVMVIVSSIVAAIGASIGTFVTAVLTSVMTAVDVVVVFLSVCGILAIYFVFVTPVCVLEGAGAVASCSRTGQLVGRRRFWRTIGAVAALLLVTFGFEFVLSAAIQSCLSTIRIVGAGRFVVGAAIDCAIAVFMAPYPFIVVTLLYYDYRVRREGFDVQVISLDFQNDAPSSGGPR